MEGKLENSHLHQVIIEQQKKIDEMQNKIIELSDYILRLSLCKLTNPQFSYYDYIVSCQISPEKQSKIDILFFLLGEKIEGKTIEERFRKKIKDYPTDFLFSKEALKYKDVNDALKKILGATSNEFPLELIEKLKDQGFYVKICDYLLSQSNGNNKDINDDLEKNLGTTSNEIPLKVIKKLKAQGSYVKICDYLLSQSNGNNKNKE